MNRLFYWILLLVTVIAVPAAVAGKTDHKNDPHYIKVGFFDLHVCNWPDRDLFFLAVFSSTQFQQIEKVSVFAPDGAEVGKFNLEKYRLIKKKGKPLKKIFLAHMAISGVKQDGWYRAEIRMKDGRRYEARDFVRIQLMERAQKRFPPPNAKDIDLPKVLTWKPIPGAKYYRVSIKDLWEDERVIHSSKLLAAPRFKVPANLLQRGGYYSWRVHARDLNKDPLLGDFNHGSLTGDIEFMVRP